MGTLILCALAALVVVLARWSREDDTHPSREPIRGDWWLWERELTKREERDR